MSHADDLTEVLVGLGVDIRKVQNDEINGRCPVHHLTKGRESTRYSWYLNYDTGLWYCFSCGARGNLSHLISTLTDDPAALWHIQSHLITSGLQRLTSEEQEVREERPKIDWGQYSRMAMLPDAVLNNRKLDRDTANRYGIRWDTENRATVIPIVSPLGELWGWQLKKVGWVRNYPEGVHKGDTLFGIERAHAPVAVLVESPLDVVRFHSVMGSDQYSAVASFGANISSRQIGIITDRFDGIIVALDNDKAGEIETRRLAKSLPSFRRGIRYWKYPENTKDIGDLSTSQIVSGVETVSSLYV